MSLTLQKFFETVYLPIVLNGCSGGHRYLAQLSIRKLDRWNESQVRFTTLTDKLLADFTQSLSDGGLKPTTVNSYAEYIKAIWREAKRRGLSKTEPTLPGLREPKRMPTAWTPTEVGLLIQSARMETGKFGEFSASAWWTALFLVAYDTGLRRGSLLKIKREDVSLKNRSIHARAETMKDGEDMLLFFSDQTKAAIEAIWEPKRALLFQRPHRSWRSFHRRMLRIVLRSGLDNAHKILQRIRRTTATLADNASPGAGSMLLGHSTPALTKKYYIDPRLAAETKRVVELLPRP